MFGQQFDFQKMSEGYGKREVNEDMFQEQPLETLTREAVSIGLKMKYTLLMLPGDRDEAISRLKQWDLWGPLCICFLFSLGIGIAANAAYKYDSFINVFAIYWVGAAFAGINCRLLGNKGSIFQSISVIGYCMIPLSIIGLFVAVLPSNIPAILRVILITIALVWSTISCLIVMRDLVSETRKYLCAYPILLFYIFLSWYAIVA